MAENRTFRHNGTVYQIPSEATDEMIISALGVSEGDSFEELTGSYSGAMGGVEGISETPGFQQNIKLSAPVGPLAGKEVEGPTPEFLTDMLPAILGTLGGGAGSVMAPGLGTAVLGGLGSGAGEALRQEIRSGQGFAPATGMTQEFLELDPTGTAAKFAGVGSEMLAGLLGELTALRGAKAAPALREKALRENVKALTDTDSDKLIGKLMDDLRPVQSEFPIGTRGRQLRRAERLMGPAGEAVEEAYTKVGGTPSSYEPVAKGLEREARKSIETRGTTKIDESLLPGRKLTGEPVEVLEKIETKIEPGFRDKKLYEAMIERANKLRGRERTRRIVGGIEEDVPETVTLYDLWKQRQQASIDAEREASQSFSLEKPTKEFTPGAQAAMTEYDELRTVLNTTAPDAKIADDRYHALATMLDLASKSDRSHFLARFGVSGMVRGPASTPLAVLAAVPSVYRTALAKGTRGIANALEAGSELKAVQIFRGMLDAKLQPDTKPLSGEGQ